jgi:hypothetical protein
VVLPAKKEEVRVKLPETYIYQISLEQFKNWSWTPPEVPDFAGPDDLARVLVSYRTRLDEIRRGGGDPQGTPGDIPDHLLEPLLTVGYRASLLTEEGRPVLACLYAPRRRYSLPEIEEAGPVREALSNMRDHFLRQWQEQEDATRVHRFAEPLPLDNPKHLARFAPTLGSEDAVLVVCEQGGRLVTTGISLLDRTGAEGRLTDMPREWKGRDGLWVQVFGPGNLRVSDGELEYTLREGKIRVYQAATYIRRVRSWLDALAGELATEWEKEGIWYERYRKVPELAVVDLSILWNRVLREAVRLQHGGAFVVLPEVKAAPVHIKYPVQQLNLGQALQDSWRALARVWQDIQGGDGKSVAVDVLEAKRSRVHRLCSVSRSVGHLSATDGCVVLDRKLVLHGFGGSIQATGQAAKRCVYVVGAEEQEMSEPELLRPFGERHKSAFRLCKQVPGSLAFVISQDGDLRLFAGGCDRRFGQ